MSDVNRASLTDIHLHTHCNQKICLQTDIEVLMSLGFFYCFTLYNLNSNTRVKGLTSFFPKDIYMHCRNPGMYCRSQLFYMQCGFIRLVEAFCTFIYGRHRWKSHDHKLSRSVKHSDNKIPLEHAVGKFTLNTNSVADLYVLSTTQLM